MKTDLYEMWDNGEWTNPYNEFQKYIETGMLNKDEAERLESEAEISAKIDMLLEPTEQEKVEFHNWVECEKAKGHKCKLCK